MSQSFPDGPPQSPPPQGPSPAPLPSGEVLNEAFQFSLRCWSAVLRLAWLPLVLCGLIFLGYGALAFVGGSGAGGEPAGIALRVPGVVAFVLGAAATGGAVYLFAGFMTSIYRLVATGEERPGLAVLRADPPVMRVFLAMVIVNAAGFALMGAGLALAMLVTATGPSAVAAALAEYVSLAANASATGQPVSIEALERLSEPLSVLFLGAVGALAPIIYLNVRLAPFAAAAAVENRLLLLGSFHLTRGRFWSIFFIFFLLLVSILALSIIIQLGSAIFQQLGQALLMLGGAAGLAGSGLLLIAFLIGIGFQLFSTTLQVAAQGIIYRLLKTGE